MGNFLPRIGLYSDCACSYPWSIRTIGELPEIDGGVRYPVGRHRSVPTARTRGGQSSRMTVCSPPDASSGLTLPVR